jgi:hypothetical protein
MPEETPRDPGGPEAAAERGASSEASSGPGAGLPERYRARAAAAGYAGLFAGLALVFFYMVVGGLDQTWAKTVFWAALGVALVAVAGGVAFNYQRVIDLFSSRKGVAGMSVALAVALGRVILVLANYVSFRHYRAWDVTEDARFTLSQQTMNWLRRLEEGERTLRIVTFIPYDVKSRLTGMPPHSRQLVVDLLRLYGENCARIVVQHTELETRRAAAIDTARGLGIKEKSVPTETVVLKYGEKRRDVKLQDIIKTQPSFLARGPAMPPVFKGEDAITSAIRILLDEKSRKICFLTGHGERTPGYDPLDLSTAVEGLKGMNFEVEELNLARAVDVPADADCLVLAGPTRPIPSRGPDADELGAIERHLDGGGSMLVLLDNTVLNEGDHPSGIERLLKPYGIIVHQDKVAVGYEMRGGPVTKGVPNASNEPSSAFARSEAYLYRPCCLETEKAEKESYGVRPILEGTDGSWGETDFGRRLSYDEDQDMKGPTVLGVTAVPVGEDEAERARIVVFSDVDWLTNQFLEDPAVARFGVNVDLFVASVNWMVGRMENVGISPKEEDVRIADVRQEQRSQLFWGIVIGPSALMIALGIYVWRARSR